MKKSITISLLILGICLVRGMAQQPDNPEEQKRKQQEEVRIRKEMLAEQEREMRRQAEEMQKQFRVQQEAIEEQARRAARVHVNVPEVHVEPDDFYFFGGNQTQLTLRNTFRGGSDSSKGEFEVEDDTRRIRCMINGKVRAGEIRIKVFYPGGKVFKDITIDPAAEISFSQTITFREESEKKYLGTWKYEVSAEEAEGNYMLQISTS